MLFGLVIILIIIMESLFFLRDKIFPILIYTLNFKQSVLIFYIYHYNIYLKYNIVLRCIPGICSSVGIPQCRRSHLGFICVARVFLAVSSSLRLCPLTMWSLPHCRGSPLFLSVLRGVFLMVSISVGLCLQTVRCIYIVEGYSLIRWAFNKKALGVNFIVTGFPS